MMEPSANIYQVKEDISKLSENMKYKLKSKAVINYRVILGHIEDHEPGYSWNEYVTR